MNYDADFPIDDEGGELIPVYILKTWPGAPVTINKSLYPQIVISRQEAHDLISHLEAACGAYHYLSPHVQANDGWVTVIFGRARHLYCSAGTRELLEQLKTALSEYEHSVQQSRTDAYINGYQCEAHRKEAVCPYCGDPMKVFYQGDQNPRQARCLNPDCPYLRKAVA